MSKLAKIFDVKHARKLAQGHDIKVALRKHRLKGTSLYAAKDIKKGNVIAYYKFKVYREGKHRAVKRSMYTMTVYTRGYRDSKNFVGDIFAGSMAPPKRGITYWAYFANEPSGKQVENAYLDTNIKQNYRKRSRIKEGDTMVYKLRAERNIKKGEEITWCYGAWYGRTYKANCED